MIVGSPDAYVSIELLAVHWKYFRYGNFTDIHRGVFGVFAFKWSCLSTSAGMWAHKGVN